MAAAAKTSVPRETVARIELARLVRNERFGTVKAMVSCLCGLRGYQVGGS